MKYVLLASVWAQVFLYGCNNDKCEGAADAGSTVLNIRLLNSAGTQSLFNPSRGYFRDSVRVFDEQSSTVALLSGPTLPAENVAFLLLERNQTPKLNALTTRRFILYLKRTDQDTVRVEYELFKNDCNRPEVRSLQVFYNAAKVYEGSDTRMCRSC
ncbi:hypothetical protein [Hymenobacter algoricola]|uniref:Lipoprotein n=1 Tax=Hymenobacter algoricola TaxID=486267 RepID=A0ABP7N4T0_9BACT